MAETLPNGTVIPNGSDLINANGVQAMRNMGASVDAQLAGRSPVGHTHDDRYFTEAEVTSKLAAKENVEAVELTTEDLNTVTTPGKYYQTHSGEATPATNYPVPSAGSLRVKANAARTQVQQFYNRFSTSVHGQYWRVYYGGVWSPWWQVVESTDPRLSNARTPLAHTHTQADVTGLETALAGKASSVHAHAISDVTGLQAALDSKASAATTVTDSDVDAAYTAYMAEMGA